jgi:hypothetical protein
MVPLFLSVARCLDYVCNNEENMISQQEGKRKRKELHTSVACCLAVQMRGKMRRHISFEKN